MAAVKKDPSAELDYSKPTDATRIREMLQKMGMNQMEGARELDISARSMRYYCAGEPVPKVVMLALERLLDLHRRIAE